MARRRHHERHFAGSDAVRDVILGMSDGLTTPVALAAGLAGAAPNNLLVVIGGLAEIAAGSISMGLGGSAATVSGAPRSTRRRTPSPRSATRGSVS